MAYSDLDFEFENRPRWRDPGEPTTDQMVTEIVEFRKRYEELPNYAKQFCTGRFSSIMCVESIKCSYIGGEDLEAECQTKEELQKYATSEEGQKEELNTHKAMKKFHEEILKEMKGSLTVQQVCEVHGILMKGLHPEAGKIRDTPAYTVWKGSRYDYSCPYEVKDKFYGVVDHHYIYIEHLSSLEKFSKEEVVHVFKCAARLLFDFVDTHPFGNGNGRMCRLLANYVVNLITPFPVCFYGQKGCGRIDYIEAIVQCRDSDEKEPREIASMLVEGVWNGWNRFFSYDHNKIGSFVVQASKTNKVAENVKRIFEAKKCELDVEEAIKHVVEAVKAIDLKDLTTCSHFKVPVEVTPPDKRYIVLEVFK